MRGQIISDGGLLSDNLVVEIETVGGRQTVFGDGQAYVNADGSFGFRDLPAGQYMLTVRTIGGPPLSRQYVSVPYQSGRLDIVLPVQKKERPVSGTISVNRLKHKVPKEARKEFERADEAAREDNSAKAVEHLEKAIAEDPEYMEAYNNLGRHYLILNQVDKGLAAFEKAMSLDPLAAIPAANASGALLMLGRFDDAEKTARKALDIDSQSPLAHYTLGMSLAVQNRSLEEAEQHLRRVSDRYANAAEAVELLVKHRTEQEIAAARADGNK